MSKEQITAKLQEVAKLSIPGFKSIFGDDAESRLKKEGHFLQSEMIKSASQRGVNLHDCTAQSISSALIECVTMGWTLNPSMKQASLVPRYMKEVKQTHAILQDGYHGWVYLLKRSGDIVDCITGAIDKTDTFEYEDTEKGFRYKWTKGEGDRSNFRGAFCIFRMPDGFKRGRFYTAFEIKKRANVATTTYIWNAWFEEMAMKTAIRMNMAHLPKSETISKLETFDNRNYDLKLVELDDDKKAIISASFDEAENGTALNGAWMKIEPAFRGQDWVLTQLKERREAIKVKALKA